MSRGRARWRGFSEELLTAYEPRIANDFMATLPPPTQATS